MRLTIHTDYALRLLIHLAAIPPGERVTIAAVAAAYGIPKNHLTKVAHRLGLAGYVATLRGKGGGLRLARPMAAINLGAVVRETEPDMALAPCFAARSRSCPILPACDLVGILREAEQAFLAVLDRHSLADLVSRKSVLRHLLTAAPA